MNVALHITHETPVPRGLPAALRKHLHGVLRFMKIDHGSWSITLVDDAAMAELHGRTLGLPTTTDVLTFDLREKSEAGRGKAGAGAAGVDLDTIICVDEAGRRARELGHPLLYEVLLYALHSLLHVCGYDDKTPAQAQRMHRHEDHVLTALNVGSVYKYMQHKT